MQSLSIINQSLLQPVTVYMLQILITGFVCPFFVYPYPLLFWLKYRIKAYFIYWNSWPMCAVETIHTDIVDR